MNKIKTVKIKEEDGSISEESYTIAADAINIDMQNGKDLQETVGNIDVDNDGNIETQLKNKINKNDIIDNLNSTDSNKVLSANQGKIIGDKINKKPYYYDNVADMKADTKLKAGDMAITLGYYEPNDGGAGEYQIIDGNYTDDSGKYHKLNNGLYAKLVIKNDIINIKQFGAYGDGIHDDTAKIQNAINISKNICGNLSETYLVSNLSVLNKNLENINIKCLPFEAQVGNTYRRAFNIEGYNNFINVSVESYFYYTPSINIYAGSTSNVGIASNVKAFRVTSGITNFYKCKAKGCWAFDITGAQKVNIYDFTGNLLEMSIYLASESLINVYNSNFEIDKQINSIYYHHLYQIHGCTSYFYNCKFTETGIGNIGNHYHGYSTSFTDQMEVTGRMEFNNCTLITSVFAGQLNGSNCVVNGGRIEAANLFAGGDNVTMPLATLNNVYIKLTPVDSTSMTFCRTKINNCNLITSTEGENALFDYYIEIENSKIILTGTTNGTKYISRYQYKIYNTIIEANGITLSTHIPSATDENILDRELILDNVYLKAKSFSWCYPYYCTNIKFTNIIYDLIEQKTTTNPVNRGSAGYIYNCIFKNWILPLNPTSDNNLKVDYIYNTIKKSNIN